MSNDLKPSPHLGGFTLLKGKLAPGQCADCAVVHIPEQPHNQQSLHYQYAFREKHGRWPTWHDAMAHCTDEVKADWTAALAERGVVVAPPLLKFFVTFGVKYRHEVHPQGYQPGGYLLVEAPDYATARALTVSHLSDKWAFIYSEAEFAKIQHRHPAGVLHTLTHQP